jgi:hypothetical protein
LHGLRFMAKRPKFYAAFNRFNYQQSEIWYFLGFAKPGIFTYRNEVEPQHDLERVARIGYSRRVPFRCSKHAGGTARRWFP